MAIIDADNFSFSYNGKNSDILTNISFSASEGELVLLCGATACGKTTLLKCMKPELAPNGRKRGSLSFLGSDISTLGSRRSASEIGFVMQRPENQPVTDRVRSELAFGCENLGLPCSSIGRRICEVSEFFGLSGILDREISSLSGGQLQLVNLASIIAAGPRLLLLDEPTAQLDPIAAGEFIRTLYRITRELSVTVIIAEHRFSEILPLADKVIFLENGSVSSFGTPEQTAESIAGSESLRSSLPCGIRLWSEHCSLRKAIPPPMKLGDSRQMLGRFFDINEADIPEEPRRLSGETAVKLKNICFAYSSDAKDVISHADLKIAKGECFSLLGGNGSGKSTLLSVIAGIHRPYCGKVEILGKSAKKSTEAVGMLPQDPRSVFLFDTVGEELSGVDADRLYSFSELSEMHPFDLSGGQAQLLALTKLIGKNAEILLLDEPTKGLDGFFRDKIAEIIRQLRDEGKTIIFATHDTELAAGCADRCGIFFDGRVMSVSAPEEFFADGTFYTTDAAKTSRGLCSGAFTAARLSELCHGRLKIGGNDDLDC